MSQSVFGFIVIAIIFIVMGGVGLFAAWPDLKSLLFIKIDKYINFFIKK